MMHDQLPDDARNQLRVQSSLTLESKNQDVVVEECFVDSSHELSHQRCKGDRPWRHLGFIRCNHEAVHWTNQRRQIGDGVVLDNLASLEFQTESIGSAR